MRANLPHPLAKRLRSRRNGHRRPADPPRTPEQPQTTDHAQKPDPSVQRVRRAGGPTDRAYYTCQCGYMFQAPVSTTVTCPNCSTPQAW